MSDGFFEFSEDDSNAGFRLKRVEVYNWGTFHNKVISFPLEGRNGLLTGDIGSGKSTLVDAVTTLLVPSHRVSYNKAAGADFKERSLRSYVMGYFKSERSDGGFSARPVPLRKEGTTHSVILGVFYNEGYSQTVTLAQVFFQKESSGQPERFFLVSTDELTIADHFSDFGKELSPLKKRLKAGEHNEVFEAFPPYGAAFRRIFGLQNEQALELFHQTVSLKTVGNLTSFVQEHMLEPFDSQSLIENLIHHFEDLNKSHEAILRAKRQIEQLTPLVENLDSYSITGIDVEEKIATRDSLKYFFAGLKKKLLGERIAREEQNRGKISLMIEEKTAELVRSRADRDEVRQAIAANGGDRLENRKSELLRLEVEKAGKLRRAEDYNKLAEQLDFPSLDNSENFSAGLNRASGEIEEIQILRNDLQNTLKDLDHEFRLLRESHGDLKGELDSLKQRKSNIDFRQIEIRRQLCAELGLDESDLPFAGELLMVRDEEREWEGSLERVLRSFALSLLVPDEHYSDVSGWVDKTYLKGRLVYYRVGEYRKSPVYNADPALLPEKVDIKEDSPHRGWLKEQLRSRFDYTCCDTLGEFRRTGKGLTKAGQVKGSSIHHEKDDRHHIGDRSRYVLGWTNLSKISLLTDRLGELEGQIRKKAEEITVLQKDENRLEDRLDLLKRLESIKWFEDMNWKPLAERMDDVKREIDELQNQSDILKVLGAKLAGIEVKISSAGISLDELKADMARIDQKIEDFSRTLAVEIQLLDASEKPRDEVSALIEPQLPRYLEGKKLYLETCDTSEREFRDKLQGEIDAGKKRQDRLLQNIVGAMQNFRRDYPSETREMDAAIESEREFRELLEKLIKDNLPRFEEKFKELLNENTIREIAAFQASLNRECQKIRERVDRINKSMTGIEYNKDRYIFLEAMNTNDTEVRGFRQELKNCIEGSFTGEGGELYTETKFLQVKELIDRFKGREGRSDSDRKWSNKVTDVRNWFAFAASERWTADDTEYEHYTDSGGKSGGQKEKLAYTVLAASLAYQFGLEWGEVRSRSFRFVVIDEAFGRGSDESARYGLELFRKLNLQLLIVTPLQKIHIIEPFVSSVGFVHNPEGKNSLLRCLTISQYKEEKERRKQ